MKTYINTSENWGDSTPVTAQDYRDQAAAFGVDVEIDEREDGIYIDGHLVAEAE